MWYDGGGKCETGGGDGLDNGLGLGLLLLGLGLGLGLVVLGLSPR